MNSDAREAIEKSAYDRGLTDGYVAGLNSARRHIAVMKKPLDMYQISHEIGKEIRAYKQDVAAGIEPKPSFGPASDCEQHEEGGTQ